MFYSSWQLRTASYVLRKGGIIAYPTEALYGLGCDPQSAEAVQRILYLKGRPAHKGFILIAASCSQLDPYVAWETLSQAGKSMVLASWPGPLTWLLPARPQVPAWLRGNHCTVAVRVSAHEPVRELCFAYGGALVSTSANFSGKPPARNAIVVRRLFGNNLDLILHGPLGGRAKPTEIREALTGRVIRSG